MKTVTLAELHEALGALLAKGQLPHTPVFITGGGAIMDVRRKHNSTCVVLSIRERENV